MALLEDQIEEARAAFVAAHEANDTEGAQVLADHLRGLQAQKAAVDTAAKESSQSGTDLRNPMIAGGVGALVGATVNPVRGSLHNIVTPPVAPPKMTAPAPTSLSAQLGQGGENWTHSLTGVNVPGAQMNKGSLDTAQRMAQTVGRGGELAGGRITEGGIMLPPDIGAKPPAPAPLIPRNVAQAKQTGKSLLQGIAGEPQPMSPFSIVKGGARGAITGATLADVPQQLAQGHYGTAGSDIGVAAGNIAHGLAKTPKGKAIGSLLGLGSGVLRGYQGINELTGEPEVQKATGGLVHLADGGQPEDAPYIGYPQINRNRQEGYGTGYLNTLATAIDPTGLTAVVPEAHASLLSETPKERSYREGKEAAQPIAEVIANLQMLNFGKQIAKPAIKYGVAKIGKLANQARNLNLPQGFAGGKSVMAEGAVDVAKKAIGFLEHTPTKPNPLVGTRYKTTDLGGLIEPKPFDVESALGSKVMHRPYDLSSRNQLVEEVSGHKLINPITTEGGQGFGRDIALQATGQGGASNKSINNRILKRVEAAAKEGDGRVFNIPSSMTYGSEAFSTMPIDILLDLIKQRELPKEQLEYLSNLVRAKSPALQNFVGFEHPEVAKQFTEGGFGLGTTPGKLRVGATQAMMGKQSGAQSLIDYNQEDLFNAIRAPELRNVPPGYMGETVMEAVPGHPGFTTGSHGAYDSGDASKYVGQGINAPISLWMPDSYKQALAEVRSAPKTAEKSLGHQRAMARNVLGTAEEGVAQTITPQVADNLQRYQEAVKSGTLDPNNLDAIHQYIYGAKAEHYAPGGKVGALGKLIEEAQAAYKAKFTPGFYHGSPSPNIKAFDPTKGTKPPEWHTPGVTFVTKNVDFAHDYVPGKATIDKMVGQPDQYMTGATVYPLNVNLGKHFDPATPESQQVVADYVAKKNRNAMPDELEVKTGRLMDRLTDPINNWSTMEHPEFLQHLRDTGHNSFAVTEAAVPNVGVLTPQNIRSKFAKFNPEDADSADFMKAAGGPVEHYAPGGKVLGGLAKFLENSVIQHPVYHGTTADFNVFKSGPRNQTVKGIYFSESPEVANKYAGTGEGANIMPVHLGLKNPASLDDMTKILDSVPYEAKRTSAQRTALLKKNGFDGLVIDNSVGQQGIDRNFVAFQPTQVKSAIGNEGTFNPLDPDITKKRGGLV